MILSEKHQSANIVLLRFCHRSQALTNGVVTEVTSTYKSDIMVMKSRSADYHLEASSVCGLYN